jgi:hypothetical protein
MGRKTVALNLDEEVYQRYKKYCEKHHMVVSRKIDALMEKELEEEKNAR